MPLNASSEPPRPQPKPHPRINVLAAHRLYLSGPEWTIEKVAAKFGCSHGVLRRRFQQVGLPTRKGRLARDLPEGLDPAVVELLSHVSSWSQVDDTVRQWAYRPPSTLGPYIGIVRRNLQRFGLDLAVVLLGEDCQDAFSA